MSNFNLTEKLKEELKKRNLWEQDDDEDDDDEDNDDEEDNDDDKDDDDTESSNHNEDFCEMACQILHSQKQAHIFHLGTKSFAEHMALNGYYSEIDELIDGIIESYQGKYGLLTNYKSFKNQSYKNKNQVLKYFTSLLNMIEEKRDCCDDSYIQNQIDTVQELIYSTMYKLKFLQ
jgi:ABC-type Zn2+ transport system substrate-binding protein/surface adhesin